MPWIYISVITGLSLALWFALFHGLLITVTYHRLTTKSGVVLILFSSVEEPSFYYICYGALLYF